jgi:hypothetical protein
MAELNIADTTTPVAPPHNRPHAASREGGCCGHDAGCGCDAGSPTQPADVREQVRERYAAAAQQVTSTEPGGCCAPTETFDGGSEVFGAALYATAGTRRGL